MELVELNWDEKTQLDWVGLGWVQRNWVGFS